MVVLGVSDNADAEKIATRSDVANSCRPLDRPTTGESPVGGVAMMVMNQRYYCSAVVFGVRPGLSLRSLLFCKDSNMGGLSVYMTNKFATEDFMAGCVVIGMHKKLAGSKPYQTTPHQLNMHLTYQHSMHRISPHNCNTQSANTSSLPLLIS